ncbi:HNH/ENDO VII family nuclease [Actinoplanes aureus]|nr:HNH/ENDO VII family nuclease [Actinoplanes aureus]
MSIELPGPMVWVINLLGYSWPEADEDAMAAAGQAWHAFAATLRETDGAASGVVREMTHFNTAASLEAFAQSWPTDQHHHELGVDAADLTGTMLEGGSTAVQATKIAILGILAVTAASIAAAAAATPFTLGASQAASLAAQQAGRIGVRKVLDALRDRAERELTTGMRNAIEDRLKRINPMQSSATGGAPKMADAGKLRKQRPKLRKSTQLQVFKDARRAPNGEDFVCPETGKIIPAARDANGAPLRFDENGRPDPDGFTVPAPNPRSGAGDPIFHFGHVSDSEYRRLVQMVEDHPGRFTQKEVLDEFNDPRHYRVEEPGNNVGHGSESQAPGYGHYGSMLNNGPQPPPQ